MALRFAAGETFADFAQSQPLRLVVQGGLQSLQRFGHWLITQAERLMMDWDDVTGAGLVGHFHGLFRGAMVPNPRLISANGHDGHFERTA